MAKSKRIIPVEDALSTAQGAEVEAELETAPEVEPDMELLSEADRLADLQDAEQELQAVEGEAIPTPPRARARRNAAIITPTTIGGSEDINVDIMPNMPWSDVTNHRVVHTSLLAIEAGVNQDNRLVLTTPEDGVVGGLTSRSAIEFGWLGVFPADFIMKLSPRLQAEVINERIQTARPIPLNLVIDDQNVQHFTHGSRDITSYADLAQTFYNVFATHDTPTIKQFQINDDGLRIVLTGQRQQMITPVVGDILQMGTSLVFAPGRNIEIALYVERLVCTNGMVSNQNVFGWSQRTATGRNHQLLWTNVATEEVFNQFGAIVDKSRQMAAIAFDGDYHTVLRERTKAMRLSDRAFPRILEAFEQEPGNTEWHLLNAITRYAAHDDTVSDNHSREIQAAAGAWAAGFDMVNARMPRPIATRVGATILEV